MAVDPSTNENMKLIVDYCGQTARSHVLKSCGEDPTKARDLDAEGCILHPQAHGLFPNQGDGKPCMQMLVQQWLKAINMSIPVEERNKALNHCQLIEGNIMFPGGFHLVKTAFCDIGTCQDCISGPLAWTFMRSEGRVFYFQKPSDPRVPYHQWYQILMAIEVNIYHGLLTEASPACKPTALDMERRIQQLIRVSPTFDALWHLVLDLHTAFALLDTETAGNV